MQADLSLGDTSRNLYKQCLSRSDGRHDLFHAATDRKIIRLIDTWIIMNDIDLSINHTADSFERLHVRIVVLI